MKQTYDEIKSLLGTLGEKLGMDTSRVTYKFENDPGPSAEGYTVGGTSETIEIPDEYMSKASANNSEEFLSWLESQ